MNVRTVSRSDFSMGIQNASSWKLRQPNEIDNGRNLRFNEIIGAIVRRNGYVASGEPFSASGKVPCGFHTAFFTTGSRSFVAVPAEDNSSTLIKVQENDGTWTTIYSSIPIGADVHFVDYRDEVFVSGYTTADNVPFQPINIDKSINVSTTRNLLFAPWPKYFIIYRGLLYAANVSVDGALFPDRFYKSSAPTGAITFVRGDQIDPPADATYVLITPKMTSATAPIGVASASTEESAANAAWQAFDRTVVATAANRWISSNGSISNQWVKYDSGVGNAKVVNRYAISLAGPYSSSNSPRAPKTWRLEGSNDNSTWTSLHGVTNAPAWSTTTAERRVYDVPSNTTAYRYHRLFVVSNQGDAAYIAIAELEMYARIQTSAPIQLNIDSARYIKVGMNISIYKAGKTDKLYDITVSEVNKINNWIQFSPESWTSSAVTTGSDTITISTTATLPTGTPIKFTSSNTLPAPLTAGTVYYVINIDATNIKVANTLDDAMIGSPIDITSAGSGSIFVNKSYVVSNNDELWLQGTFGKLSTLWNTDYPTPDKADWSAVQSGADSSIAINGGIESANRLFLFTENSTTRFDGSNPMLISKTIGCVSMRTIKSLDDDWIIWLTPRGRVYARNEAGGQQEYISRGMYNKFFSKLDITQLRTASAGITDGEYSVYVGEVDGEYSRGVYDFGSNTWSVDVLGHPSFMYANKVVSSIMKPLFVSTEGKMYQDDTGFKDGDKVTRFQIDFGKTDYGMTNIKQMVGAFIYSENSVGLKIVVSIDGSDPIVLGEITRDSGQITYRTNKDNSSLQGSVFALSLKGALDGEPQVIISVDEDFNVVQEVAAHGKPQ